MDDEIQNEIKEQPKKKSKGKKLLYTIAIVGAFLAVDYMNLPSKTINLYTKAKYGIGGIFNQSEEKKTYKLYNQLEETYTALPKRDKQMFLDNNYADDSVNVKSVVENLNDKKIDSLVVYLANTDRFQKEKKVDIFLDFYSNLANNYGNWDMLKEITKQEIKR